MERLWPHSPAPLVVVGAGIGLSWLVGLDALGVATVGFIPQSLPSITLPSLGLVQQLLPGALGIALMSFTETIAAGRAFAARADPPIKADRELLATGAANLAGAFFGAMPAGGGTSQTAVVRAVGGHTQMASLVTAAAAAATMLVLAPLLGLLPQAVLAAIVIVYSVGLIKPAEFVSDPQDPANGVSMGAGGFPWRACLRHAPGHRRGDRPFADRPGQSVGEPKGLRDRPQAGEPTCSGRCRPSTRTTRHSRAC